FDHACNGKRVPERRADAMRKQKPLLRDIRIVAALQKLRCRVDRRPAPVRQRLLPCMNSRPAMEYTRRDISAIRKEAAMQLVARAFMRLRILMRRHQLITGVSELRHISLLRQLAARSE